MGNKNQSKGLGSRGPGLKPASGEKISPRGEFFLGGGGKLSFSPWGPFPPKKKGPSIVFGGKGLLGGPLTTGFGETPPGGPRACPQVKGPPFSYFVSRQADPGKSGEVPRGPFGAPPHPWVVWGFLGSGRGSPPPKWEGRVPLWGGGSNRSIKTGFSFFSPSAPRLTRFGVRGFKLVTPFSRK